MADLSIILGAGFSANAGFPLAQNINERFNRNQLGKLLRMSSSEWFWEDGKDETFIHNGKIFNESYYYSYVLNEIVKDYNDQNKGFTDYEDFFQYVLTNSESPNWYKGIQEIAFNNFLEDNPHCKTPEAMEHFSFYKNTHFSRIIEIINYLVADLLLLNVSPDIMIKFYKPFVDYITSFDNVYIFTLNHDLLLEGIFDFFKINYSRGFTEKDSPIYFEDKPLQIFNNDFSNSKINLIKLHGSLDYYRFLNTENSQFDGKYNYFTTKGYRAKHYARRIDLKTGETLQEINSDIVPKFITGKNKPEIIKNDLMFSVLYNHFQTEISKTENLLISGYSFRDEHINLELEKRTDINVINQRKSTDYPFKGNVKNISSFDEL